MKQKIGIWGLGVGGTALLKFFARQGYPLQVMDKRTPTIDERAMLDALQVTYVPQDWALRFFEYNDIVIPSPGIDISAMAEYHHKCVAELDIFHQAWQKNSIAITGSIGKTSLVSLLETILKEYGHSVITGGNIGIGMLDIIEDAATTALLELSSFQLEYSAKFVPDFAIISNLFANHLDRHKTLENYFKAKYQILKRQTTGQNALVPWELYELLLEQPEIQHRSLYLFANTINIDFSLLRAIDTLYYVQDTYIVKYHNAQHTNLIDIETLPDVSYKANWLILVAAVDILGYDIQALTTLSNFQIPAHRCALVATRNGVSFYNDSKSTVIQATLAAVEKLQNQPIHLLLGGLSKGVNREPLIAALKNKVKTIICFGAEAEELYQLCSNHEIPAYKTATLEDAFANVVSIAQPGECVLLSPAGSSYDLFKDYKARGEKFVELVLNIK